MYKTVLLPVDLDEEASWRKALPAAVDAAFTSRGESCSAVTTVRMVPSSEQKAPTHVARWHADPPVLRYSALDRPT